MKDLSISVADRSATLSEAAVTEKMAANAALLRAVQQGESRYQGTLGWHDTSVWAGDAWLTRYEELAKEVQEHAQALVVIGIGGSNQAARAVYEALEPQDGVELIWAGNSISAHSIREALAQAADKDIYINLIAKNFETLEPGIGFRAFRDLLRQKYGSDYARHVICTGTEGSQLHQLCKDNGFRFLPFPVEIGGRFTSLSPVGLFPLAAAGVDIRALAAGARQMHDRLVSEDWQTNPAMRYAAVRNLLNEQGFAMELLGFFEPRYFRLSKWWVQLFGESEGKDNKGLYPIAGNYSEDLHSIGQFIQDGSRLIFETFLDVEAQDASYVLHDDLDDGFHYLDGKDFHEINKAAFEATVLAHSRRFPCIILGVPAIDAASFGQLFYFFEFACYLSGRMLGVNPFDQPGVEAYKTDMFRILGK